MISGLAFTILLGYTLQAYAISGINEDQYTLCNNKKVCFDFNADDYLSDSTQEEFELFYSNEMDTYDAEDLVQ